AALETAHRSSRLWQLDVGGSQFDRRLPPPAQPEIEGLHEHGEAHGEVDVALRDVQFPSLGDERHADEEQEAEGQHLHGGMVVDEIADLPGRYQHHADGDDNGRDHHTDLFGHPHRGDHRIEAENDVQQQDLDDHPRETGHDGGFLAWVSLFSLQLLVDLEGGLAEQEQAAEQEDQVTPGDLLPEDPEERGGQADDPGDGEEQEDPNHHRQTKPEVAGSRLLFLGQLPREDRDEDDVVDPEHHFQQGEGEQGDPRVRVGEPFHGGKRTRRRFSAPATEEPPPGGSGGSLYRQRRRRQLFLIPSISNSVVTFSETSTPPA